MDRIKILQETILTVIDDYLTELRQPSNEHIDFVSITDTKQNHFQIIAMGWEGYNRVFNLLFHVDIIKDKIWVQEDKMEYSITERLIEKGIAKKEIVLAYFPEYHRAYTEYAVA
jgi:XisI protein